MFKKIRQFLSKLFSIFRRDRKPSATVPTVAGVTPSEVSLDPNTWIIAYSPNMPPRPSDPWNFNFPQQDGVHYVYSPTPPLVGKSKIRMVFEIKGSGKIYSVDETQANTQGKVSLFMQRHGDNFQWDHISYRFWTGSTALAAGEYTVEAELDPNVWTNVGGKNDAEGFRQLLSNIQHVGFTFGGTFAGHGVYTTGDMSFHLKEFKIS